MEERTCKIIDASGATLAWAPRSDGVCYTADAPQLHSAWPEPCRCCGKAWDRIGFMEWQLACACPVGAEANV
jgi:hypothetical protein